MSAKQGAHSSPGIMIYQQFQLETSAANILHSQEY